MGWCTLLLVPLALFAQPAQSAPPNNPAPFELGQDGKDVVWVPTPEALAGTMLDLARVTASDTVLDLGSGDGRLVIAAARRGARARGIEYTLSLVEYSRKAAQAAGVADRAVFEKADLFEADLSWASVITVFLGPELNARLLPKLLNLKPGTRIVSNTHPIADWPADAQVESTDDVTSVYYRTARMWIVPARVAGRWRWDGGALVLNQRYQRVNGTLRGQGGAVAISDVQLRGSSLSFTASGTRYAGEVEGGVIRGQRVVSGKMISWQANKI